MEKCFVIQPFDNDKFDKRFVDIFEPAIRKADLEPYRIDKDLSVRVPIEDIERGITECTICFAEITLDNPNVWYELGFAFACGKDAIMVCSEERQGKFPFDIQHRQVITYKTGSISDFNSLGDTITKKILAFKSKSNTVKNLISAPILETEGLKGHEISMLVLIMENQLTSEESYSIYNLKTEMSKAGFTDIATSVGVRSLKKLGMIETFVEVDHWNNGQEYAACRLTDLGENWVLSNQDQLQFRKKTDVIIEEEDDGLPF